MLFNSPLFLFLFLPITLVGYHLIGKSKQPRLAIIWLIAASLLFYAWANPIYLALITGSVIFNYVAGVKLSRIESVRQRKLIMASGVSANILLLGYFKYANFFIDNTNTLLGSSFHPSTVVLPLAISFFTLQQIAYLVDIYRGERQEHGFWEYCLFVTFFPKLLSGPVVRMKEIMPQIVKDYRPRLNAQNMAVGLTTLFLGLFKKMILADHLGGYASTIFDATAQGTVIGFVNSWIGALAYTFQLYFDFSGYCDAAIGLALMFGIRLPLNFYSPYKATSIIDFWRRWHMTLSSFVRDYIYIPLGGNRHGLVHQMSYLLLAMTIIGFWHGASWTFVIWGGLHGTYLVINHSWRRLMTAVGHGSEKNTWRGKVILNLFTFIAIVIAWVFFRAGSVSAAIAMLSNMIGKNAFHLLVHNYVALGSIGEFLRRLGVTFDLTDPVASIQLDAIFWILISLFICWFLPNVQEYMSDYQPALDSFNEHAKKTGPPWLRWKPSFGVAMAIAVVAVFTVFGLGVVSKFIYFRF